MPEIFFEIATAGGVELHALSFQHSLLFICRQNYAAGRAAALRIDYALPGRLASISAMHHKSYGARSVTFAQNVRDLSVSHDPSARNAANDLVNALAVLLVGF